MTKDDFTSTLKRYMLSEAGEEAPPPDPAAGGDAPPADPAAGGDMPMPGGDMGGGIGGDIGGGLGGDPMGGMDQGQGGAGGNTSNDLCSKKYVALVSYLCELYNANVSNRRNMVLNLKVKVGEITTLNDVHNADEVFKFMVKYLLNEDVVEEVKKNVKSADEKIKQMESSGEMTKMSIHNSTSAFLIEVATYAYYAVCSNAIGDELPDINYGVTKDFAVDPKNAKAVFDEIKTNIDQVRKISEVDG